MKYAYADNAFDDSGNVVRKELARITAWHATFNAALTALIPLYDNDLAIRTAHEVANKVHEKL